MLPKRGMNPMEKIKLLKAKIAKVKKFIKKLKEIKEKIEKKIKQILKFIKNVLKKIAAALKIIGLLTVYYSNPLNVAPLYAAAEIANKEFGANIDTSKTPKEIIRQLVKKVLGKHYPKLEKWKKQ